MASTTNRRSTRTGADWRALGEAAVATGDLETIADVARLILEYGPREAQAKVSLRLEVAAEGCREARRLALSALSGAYSVAPGEAVASLNARAREAFSRLGAGCERPPAGGDGREKGMKGTKTDELAKREAEEALKTWLMVPNWHTGHACDMERFFGFVTALDRMGEGIGDEDILRERIVSTARRLGTGMAPADAERVARDRVSQAGMILDYLRWRRGQKAAGLRGR